MALQLKFIRGLMLINTTVEHLNTDSNSGKKIYEAGTFVTMASILSNT